MILILGGTAESRALGEFVRDSGLRGLISMAGVTVAPAAQALPVRTGGFGGEQGLAAYCRSEGVKLIVDVTHPFSRTMTRRAARVAKSESIDFLRLERPIWKPQNGDIWSSVATPAFVPKYIPKTARVFLTTGPGRLTDFNLEGYNVLCRRISSTKTAPPEGWRWYVKAPPFVLEEEIELMKREQITHVVTKNSGGPTDAKLAAARALHIPVVMLERPALPERIATVDTIWAALEWIKHHGDRS